jgi:hypothetical protein
MVEQPAYTRLTRVRFLRDVRKVRETPIPYFVRRAFAGVLPSRWKIGYPSGPATLTRGTLGWSYQREDAAPAMQRSGSDSLPVHFGVGNSTWLESRLLTGETRVRCPPNPP